MDMSNRSAQKRSGRRRAKRLAKNAWRFVVPPPRLIKASPWTIAAADGESKVSIAPSGDFTLSGAAGDQVIGSIQWRAAYRECGWPFPIRRQPLPIVASWTLDDPPETVSSRAVPSDHPLASAIDAQLATRSLPDWYMESLSANGDQPGNSTMLWTTAVVSLGLIWLLLYLMVRVPMVFLRAGLILQRRLQTGVETRRDRSGRCIQCGYNLTGLELAERCPECGALLW